MKQERERSRAYPVMDLEAAYELLSRQLGSLGTESLDRESLAKRLGYETGGGGVAARKIGALVQYGFLDRRSGRYSLNRKGRELQKIRHGSPKFRTAIQSALEHPALFRWIIDRYRRFGKVPENLAGVLVRDYKITARASEEAAKVFFRSARFAGFLDADGSFLGSQINPAIEEEDALSKPETSRAESRIEPFQIPLTNRRKAYLSFPDVMTDNDIEQLEEVLRLAVEKGGLRKYLQIDPKSAEGNVVPVRFGKPKS
jgi:hypothetical protein